MMKYPYRMVWGSSAPAKETLIDRCMEGIGNMLKQYDLRQYNSFQDVEMDAVSASSLQEFMATGSPFWVKELYVSYGEGESMRMIRAVDILLGKAVDAPERWVRRIGRELIEQIKQHVSVAAWLRSTILASAHFCCPRQLSLKRSSRSIGGESAVPGEGASADDQKVLRQSVQ